MGSIDPSFYVTSVNRNLPGWTSDSLSTWTRLIDSLFWRTLALEKSKDTYSSSCFLWLVSREEPKVRGGLTSSLSFFLSVLTGPFLCLEHSLLSARRLIPQATCSSASMLPVCHCSGPPFQLALVAVILVLPRALLSGDVAGPGSLTDLLMDCWQSEWTGGQSKPPLWRWQLVFLGQADPALLTWGHSAKVVRANWGECSSSRQWPPSSANFIGRQVSSIEVLLSPSVGPPEAKRLFLCCLHIISLGNDLFSG